jgi:hypothetical protein
MLNIIDNAELSRKESGMYSISIYLNNRKSLYSSTHACTYKPVVNKKNQTMINIIDNAKVSIEKKVEYVTKIPYPNI